MLSPAARAATVASIAHAQLSNGTIPWTVGERWDPWDHVECALALDAGGFHEHADAAYRHLARTQRHDGAWACPIVGGDASALVLDSNAATYVAVGIWHQFLATGDEGALHRGWRMVARAVEFALDLQLPNGAIAWARDLDGRAGGHALVASSSCILVSLTAALEIAHHLGEERPDWELAITSLAAAITDEANFASRSRYSMDWYYPVLSGALDDLSARDRIQSRWDVFVVEGLGARCVDDRPWVTSAETAELAIALNACGLDTEARELLEWVQYLRHEDGSYWTGATFPDGRHFPNERSNWSAAAMVIATDIVAGRGALAEAFARSSRTALLTRSDPVGDPS
ncbi:MAG TPA: prenyltransferase [Actinomycetota bacterium]|nr:prenyltransferase [Actinomycetota bacterium]